MDQVLTKGPFKNDVKIWPFLQHPSVTHFCSGVWFSTPSPPYLGTINQWLLKPANFKTDYNSTQMKSSIQDMIKHPFINHDPQIWPKTSNASVQHNCSILLQGLKYVLTLSLGLCVVIYECPSIYDYQRCYSDFGIFL